MSENMIGPVVDPKIEFTGALYFLDGHFLFRHRNREGMISNKFVSAADVCAAFSRTEQDSGWLPAGCVRVGSNARGPWFVYSAPEQRVEIWLGDERAFIPLPRTVLVGNGVECWMFALSCSHFDPAAVAYRAPFPNVGHTGKICWGRSAAPKAEAGKAREMWSLFFASPFNADYATDKCKSEGSDVRVLLRRLASEGAKRFPVGELVQHNSQVRIGTVIESTLEVR